MALYKRGNTWWISINHQGTRVQKSTGTSSKVAAQRFYDQLKMEVWKVDKLKERPKREWNDAVIRWCKESQHKKSLKSDICNFRWLDKHLVCCFKTSLVTLLNELHKSKKATV